MEKQIKNNDDRMKGFKRHLVPCPSCGKDILYHMSQCPFCKAEVVSNYYKPMDPEKAKKIKWILAIIGFIIVFIIFFIVR